MLNTPGHKVNANQITLRFHLTPVTMTIIKNTNVLLGYHQEEEMLVRMWGKRNPHMLLVGM
jgi:hypothetical protein